MIEVRLPNPSATLTELVILKWFVRTGQPVHVDQQLAEVETDKSNIVLHAEAAGIITLHAKAGIKLAASHILCTIQPQ